MFEAAKYINAYRFPQQTLETAICLQSNDGIDIADANARLVVSDKFSSASGANMVHESLLANSLLKETPGQGSGCTN